MCLDFLSHPAGTIIIIIIIIMIMSIIEFILLHVIEFGVPWDQGLLVGQMVLLFLIVLDLPINKPEFRSLLSKVTKSFVLVK